MRKRFILIFGLLIINLSICFVYAEGEVLFHEQKNLFVDVPDPPYTTQSIEVEHLVRAPNTKDYWERFKAEIRKDYLNGFSQDALQKQLTAKQLTYEEQLRRVIKDNEKVWSDIKNDMNKPRTNEVLERILKADNINLEKVELTKSKLLDSRFLKSEGKDVFQYGLEKAKFLTSDENIKKLLFEGMNITFNSETNDSITINAGMFYALESLTEGEKASGRIEKPFENIDCFGRGKETKFLKDITDLNILTFDQGEFLCSDKSFVIGGISQDKTNSEILFENVPLNTFKQGYTRNSYLTLANDNELIAKIHTPNLLNVYTTFRFSPSVSSFSFVSLFNLISVFDILPMVSAFASVARMNSDQFIYIVNHDLSLSGESIFVEIFQPFEKLTARGFYLSVLDGKMLIEFRNRDTYYSRLVKNNDFFINEIKNEYDSRNLFQFAKGGSRGNFFVDKNKRLSVGDALTSNPVDGYENVLIPEIRFKMWKKAAESA